MVKSLKKITAVSEPPAPQIHFDLSKARQRLLKWYRRQDRNLPWRILHQKTGSPYPVWVSEIMLQQTVMQVVIPKFIAFMEKFPTVLDLAEASETELRQAVAGLGYYRRFANLHRTAKLLAASTPPRWPSSAKAWMELPGIGAYTSNAIASIAFDEAVAVVDGNVERVFCRLLDWRIAPAPKHKPTMQRLADRLLARETPGDFNQAVMELGQLVCTKAAPKCQICPVEEFCKAKAQESQSLAPAPKQRKALIDVELRLGIFQQRGRTLLIKRSLGSKFLKDAWGFPTFIKVGNRWKSDGGEGIPPASIWGETFGEVQHNITHHRIAARIQALNLIPEDFEVLEQQWVPHDQVADLLVSNLDRKAWRQRSK